MGTVAAPAGTCDNCVSETKDISTQVWIKMKLNYYDTAKDSQNVGSFHYYCY